jgi:hypothetical protein
VTLVFKKARVERERQREYERISDEITLVHAKATSPSLPPFLERVSSIPLSSTVHPAPSTFNTTPPRPHPSLTRPASVSVPAPPAPRRTNTAIDPEEAMQNLLAKRRASTLPETHSDNQMQDSAMCNMPIPKALQRVQHITVKTVENATLKLRHKARAARAKED